MKAWHQHPIPPRWHRCKVAQSGWVGALTIVERCACGAIRINSGGWQERNTRRKMKR